MAQVAHTVESDSDSVLYAMDETALQTESDNRKSWSPIGVSPILESNGSHKGLNLIGATELTKNFDTIIDAYSSDHSITGIEIKDFLQSLLDRNPVKKVVVILDNARTHNNKLIQAFWAENRDRLTLINLPPYSPQLNPQENIWNLLKNKIFCIGARGSIDELFSEVVDLYNHLNEQPFMIKSIAFYKNYYLDEIEDIG
ncbi:MAG: IS630 family transposase [Sarcina sp.]